jgi:hypothetical protein
MNSELSVLASVNSTNGIQRLPLNTPTRKAPQQATAYQTTVTGAKVQANAYWTAAGITPPSATVPPGVRGEPAGKGCGKARMYSDVQAVVARKARKDDFAGTRNVPIAGFSAVTVHGAGVFIPTLEATNGNFTANPVPGMSQLCNVAQDNEMGSEYHGAPFVGRKPRGILSLLRGKKTTPYGIVR